MDDKQINNVCWKSGSLLSIYISKNVIAIFTHYFNTQSNYSEFKVNKMTQIDTNDIIQINRENKLESIKYHKKTVMSLLNSMGDSGQILAWV